MITSNAGPLVIFGQANFADYNSSLGPSLFQAGYGIMDPRGNASYQPGNAATTPFYGWYGVGGILLVNATPSALSATNIAAAQTPTAGTPLTLVSSSGSGITVGASALNVTTGVTTTGVLALDGAMGFLPMGTDGGLNFYDPTKALARNVRITSAGNDSSATFTVSGFDIYGLPQTATVTGANAGVASTTKAFKYIKSVTPAGTLSGSNVSVGTGDVYSFPMRADTFGQIDIFYAGSFVTSSTGFTAAVTTSPATSLTGDPHGTYALQSASNGSNVLQIYGSVNINDIYTGSTGGLPGLGVAIFGVTPA